MSEILVAKNITKIYGIGTQAASAFSTYNAVCSALLMLTAMRERRETRGAHLRLDYPEKRDGNMRYVTFRPSGEVAFGPVR